MILKQVTSFIAGVLILIHGYAQQCPPGFAGTKTLYPTQQKEYFKIPKGYQPVFINYVGRHGARHLTKDVNTSFAYNILSKADSLGSLTAKGKEIWTMVLELEKVEKTNFKSISRVGENELRGIAARMYFANGSVIANHSFATVEITKEKRTLQSATVFVNELQRLSKRNDSIRYSINDTTLRFFDIAPAYLSFEENGDWRHAADSLQLSLAFEKICERTGQILFKSNFRSGVSKNELATLTGDLFGFITILPSIRQELGNRSLDFASVFTCNDLQSLGKLDNAEDFLLKGPGKDSMGIQVLIAAPLLMDFLNSSSDFIQGNGAAVRLRFAHAETIAPFAALLGIAGANNPVNTIDQFEKSWEASTIVPLSANIQWIVYRKKKGKEYLVKLLLNEREVTIDGLLTKTFPYYNLEALRKFYLLKLHTAGLDPGEDYNHFLHNLR